MATNDFQTFAGDPAADVMAQADYIASGFTARILGFSTGTALSIQLNKVWRQASLISAMVGQFTADVTGQDMLDDGSPAGMSALQSRFTAAITTVARGAVGAGYLPLTGGTLTGPLVINAGGAITVNAPAGQYAQMGLSRAAGQGSQIVAYTGATVRWNVVLASTESETGNNFGSNFSIVRYSDAGAVLDSPLSILRSTGVVNFARAPTVAGAAMPYLPLAGGALSGALTVGGYGINYSSYYGGHYIGYGWDGAAIGMWVDNTYQGEIASRAYVTGIAGAYLPLAGGVVSGSVEIQQSLVVDGGAGFRSSVWFNNQSDFINFSSGIYRYRQWAGSWYDYWNGQNGTRGWATPSAGMSLDGSANLTISGQFIAYGSRIICEGGQPSICAYSTAGVAVGIWADASGLWLGNMDGGGNPNAAHMLIDNNGNSQIWGNLSVHATLFVDSNISCAQSVYASANLWSANNVYAGAGSGAILTSDGVLYQGRGPGYNIAFMYDGTTFWRFANGDQREVIQGDNSQRVRQLGMSGVTMHWIDADGSGWFANTYRSDPRYKRNIQPAGDFDSLAAIVATPTRAFEWREDYNMPPVPYGFISTDIRQSLPDAVMAAASEEGQEPVDHLDPMAMFAHVFRAIAQLDARLSAVGA